MTNHPNRSRRTPRLNPTPADIVREREKHSLTQTEAAALIHCTLWAWQKWEGGTRQMRPALWELFLLKSREAKRVGNVDDQAPTPAE